MAIDKEAIKEHIRGILVALGDDPNREGLKETPDRVAKMYEEVFEGMNYSNHEIAQMFSKTFEDDLSVKDHKDMVIVKDIDIFSYCEHHMALMYDMKVSVAYLPKDKVLGLSKIARICDMVGKRLQLQERIGSDIAEIIMEVSGSEDVAVYIEGCHSCMSARGIKKQNAKTVTTTLRGAFDTDSSTRTMCSATTSFPPSARPATRRSRSSSSSRIVRSRPRPWAGSASATCPTTCLSRTIPC